MKHFFLTILFFTVTGFILGKLRTLQIESDERQKIFTAGKIPSEMPDGFHKGSARGYSGAWQGKTFDRKNSTGINVLKNGESVEDKFPFKTYVAKGVRDDQEVIKIDYNIPENPFWLRLILDEIVETEPNQFLGKVHLKLPFGIVFTLGYFHLKI